MTSNGLTKNTVKPSCITPKLKFYVDKKTLDSCLLPDKVAEKVHSLNEPSAYNFDKLISSESDRIVLVVGL